MADGKKLNLTQKMDLSNWSFDIYIHDKLRSFCVLSTSASVFTLFTIEVNFEVIF